MLPRYWHVVGKAPLLEIETSTFASDWQKALEQPQHADVVFIAEGQHSFKAHKVVLCSASRFFRQVLNPDLTSQVQAGMYKLIALTVTDAASILIIRVWSLSVYGKTRLPSNLRQDHPQMSLRCRHFRSHDRRWWSHLSIRCNRYVL